MKIWLNSDELGVLEGFSGAKAKCENRYNPERHSYSNWKYRSKEEGKLHQSLEKNELDNIMLFRYMSLTELWKIVFDKTISLISPQLWNDPLESPLLNAKVLNKKGKERKDTLRSKFYAQCFTIDKYSESMWTNYGNGSDMVRVSIKLSNLIEQLDVNDYDDDDIFLGRVVYLAEEDIEMLIKDNTLIKKAYNHDYKYDQIKTLLLKRYQYQFEKEIRLIVDGTKYKKLNNKIKLDAIPISILEPTELISKITFHPGFAEHEYLFYKKHLEEKGYKCDKNRLYDKSKSFTLRP